MVFNDTFNNISVCWKRVNTITLTLVQQYFSLFHKGVRVMMFNDTFNNICLFESVVKHHNDTFNNISVCFRGLGLWSLNTFNNISVCFRGLTLKQKYWKLFHNPNPLKQTEVLLKVIITLTLTLKVILNHKGQYLVHHCYIRLTVKYHNPNPNPKSNIKPQGSISSPSLLYKTYS